MACEDLRIGHGYDLHRLEARPPGGVGRPLRVGGCDLESEVGPIAHSDGDVLYHAVTDAILSAAGLEDIGQMFPNSDPLNEGRDSTEFVEAAAVSAAAAGWELVSLDCTVVLERPRLAPLRTAMRSNLAGALGAVGGSVEKIGVKGKSHEGVDAVGEGRAIECHVVALLRRR
ncbi:MAG: 2-C-methyl-D-erythritol 2,4-cyclodiphosphate synthase [Phycisphaeraceae bacterium]|nr:2-C-methyl-D-erythritol 2,4-cyclodiphosphate synthase [Phycisphaeraceae bacterium]